MKKFLCNRLLIIGTAFFLSISFIKAQDILRAKDLTTIKVDALSDDDIAKLRQQLQQNGLSESQAEQLALQKGMPAAEVSKLRARLASVTPGSRTASSGSSRSEGRSFDTSLLSKPPVETGSSVFGSELFNNSNLSFEPNLRIATPKNYSIGPDDELVIDVFGYQEANYRLTVSAEGTITIPYIGSIPVVGLTVEQATKRIKDKMQRNGYGSMASGQTQLQVNIGKIRSIKITVIGEAKRPGTYSLSSLSTLFNALYAAGGLTDRGSFRQIELVRNNKPIIKLDAYDFLLKGDQSNNVSLVDQDVIRIPVAQTQVSLQGEIKRPGIFEVLPSEKLQQVIDFAGGFSNEAYTASIQIKQITDKERRVKDVKKSDYNLYQPQRGDSIFISKILNRYNNRVQISGAVYRPGSYELESGLTILSLISKAEGLKEEAFQDRGLLIRTNDTDLTKRVIPFNVKALMSKINPDIVLQKNDEIIIGAADAYKQNYTLTLEGEVKKPGIYNYYQGITLNDLLFLAQGFTDASAIDKIEVARRLAGDSVTKGNNLALVIDASTQTNLSKIGGDVFLSPWDIVIVRRKPDYKEQVRVKVEGEVKFPGNYILVSKNEKVSSLINRAGGLTNFAFTEGASLTRMNNSFIKNDDKVRKIQKQIKDTTAADDLIEDLTKSTIRVGLDLATLLQRPEGLEDVILQEGDVLTIPKAKREIKVNGEVMVPSEVVFKVGENLNYYINKAGGFTDNARKGKVYVLYPNGSADRIRRFLFFKRTPEVTAGAEILVPQVPERQGKGLSTSEVLALTTGIASLAGVVIALLRL